MALKNKQRNDNKYFTNPNQYDNGIIYNNNKYSEDNYTKKSTWEEESKFYEDLRKYFLTDHEIAYLLSIKKYKHEIKKITKSFSHKSYKKKGEKKRIIIAISEVFSNALNDSKVNMQDHKDLLKTINDFYETYYTIKEVKTNFTNANRKGAKKNKKENNKNIENNKNTENNQYFYNSSETKKDENVKVENVKVENNNFDVEEKEKYDTSKNESSNNNVKKFFWKSNDEKKENESNNLDESNKKANEQNQNLQQNQNVQQNQKIEETNKAMYELVDVIKNIESKILKRESEMMEETKEELLNIFNSFSNDSVKSSKEMTQLIRLFMDNIQVFEKEIRSELQENRISEEKVSEKISELNNKFEDNNEKLNERLDQVSTTLDKAASYDDGLGSMQGKRLKNEVTQIAKEMSNNTKILQSELEKVFLLEREEDEKNKNKLQEFVNNINANSEITNSEIKELIDVIKTMQNKAKQENTEIIENVKDNLLNVTQEMGVEVSSNTKELNQLIRLFMDNVSLFNDEIREMLRANHISEEEVSQKISELNNKFENNNEKLNETLNEKFNEVSTTLDKATASDDGLGNKQGKRLKNEVAQIAKEMSDNTKILQSELEKVFLLEREEDEKNKNKLQEFVNNINANSEETNSEIKELIDVIKTMQNKVKEENTEIIEDVKTNIITATQELGEEVSSNTKELNQLIRLFIDNVSLFNEEIREMFKENSVNGTEVNKKLGELHRKFEDNNKKLSGKLEDVSFVLNKAATHDDGLGSQQAKKLRKDVSQVAKEMSDNTKILQSELEKVFLLEREEDEKVNDRINKLANNMVINSEMTKSEIRELVYLIKSLKSNIEINTNELKEDLNMSLKNTIKSIRSNNNITSKEIIQLFRLFMNNNEQYNLEVRQLLNDESESDILIIRKINSLMHEMKKTEEEVKDNADKISYAIKEIDEDGDGMGAVSRRKIRKDLSTIASKISKENENISSNIDKIFDHEKKEEKEINEKIRKLAEKTSLDIEYSKADVKKILAVINSIKSKNDKVDDKLLDDLEKSLKKMEQKLRGESKENDKEMIKLIDEEILNDDLIIKKINHLMYEIKKSEKQAKEMAEKNLAAINKKNIKKASKKEKIDVEEYLNNILKDIKDAERKNIQKGKHHDEENDTKKSGDKND